MSLYRSPSTVVVMYWFDLRTDDSFDSFIEPEVFDYPASLRVSISPQLQLYHGDIGDRAASDTGSFLVPDDFTLVDSGELEVTVSPTRNVEHVKHRIAGLPEALGPLRLIEATVTETPLLYCVRLDLQNTGARPLGECSMPIDLLDENGEALAYITQADRARLAGNGSADIDLRLEAMYPKQDDRQPKQLVLTPILDGEALPPIYIPWALQAE